MDMTIRPMTKPERMYSYTQSQQIMGQTGCIGHLRSDLGTYGGNFFCLWEKHNADLDTNAFNVEFNSISDAMRFDPQYGGILKDQQSMRDYCCRHPDSSFGNDREYGFRADTAQYAYLLRLNPSQDENNLYIYCYRRDFLDRHMMHAGRGIRFITPSYKELFRIPDGDSIRIIRPDGTHTDKTCHYIDDTHVEVGGGWDRIFHIGQFAEQMERCGNTVIPLRSSLPEQCYVYLPTTQEIGIVKKGESGYYRSDLSTVYGEDGKDFVDEMNHSGGVSKAQAAAMSAGSMFGWATPAADPANYDDQGKLMKPRHADRGDAR